MPRPYDGAVGPGMQGPVQEAVCPARWGRGFSQLSGCNDVAQALLPAGVPSGPGTHADALATTLCHDRESVSR
jgi:hypothetical protein